MTWSIRGLALASVVLLGAATSCTDNGGSSSGGDDAESTRVEVTSTPTGCTLSEDSAPAGTLSFEVHNDGGQVTEFYLLAEDGTDIISEVENIGPGLQRDMVVDVEAGTYIAACKPGMTGDGIRSEFTVTD